jgi:hypothetical protein
MPAGVVVVKDWSDLEAGIDIYLGTSQLAIQPLRIFDASGSFLAGITALGNFQGGLFLPVVATFTASGQITANTGLVIIDATGGNVAVTLPAVGGGGLNRTLTIIRKDSSANTASIVTSGGATIDGSTATILLENQFGGVTLYGDAANHWFTTRPDFAEAARAIKTVTTTYTVLRSDNKVLGDTTAAAFTITLPAASGVPAGWEVRIEKIDATANGTLTVSRAGADTIEGATTVALATLYSNTKLTSDGVSVWYKL